MRQKISLRVSVKKMIVLQKSAEEHASTGQETYGFGLLSRIKGKV
jgi:hypothetical protein